MATFDVHQHLWPEPFVAALARRKQPPRLARRGRVLELAGEGSLEVDLREHDLERRVALLDRDGIDVAVVSLPPTLEIDLLPPEEAAELLDAYHDGTRELIAAAGGRLRAFAAGRCVDGFVGVSVSGRALVEETNRPLERLLAEVERRRQVLFVHPGPAPTARGLPAWWPALADYTAEMQAAYLAWLARGAPRHPDLRVVFAILAGGAPFQLERLASRGVAPRSVLHENLYLDVASYGRRALELVLATYGVRQLVYGSDTPVIDAWPTLRALRDFGDAVAEVVSSENPSLLFA